MIGKPEEREGRRSRGAGWRRSGELERLGRALAWTSEAVALCDAHGVPSYVNPAFARRFGLGLAECIEAGGLAGLFAHDPRFPELGRALGGDSAWEGELDAVTRHGAQLKTRVRVDRIFEESGSHEYVVLLGDPGGDSESEALAFQSTHLMGRMAAGIAHEFGNVFNVVGLEARLIREATEPLDSRAELAQRIMEAAKQGGRLVRQLRMLGGRRSGEIAVLDLDEVCRATLALLEPFLGRRLEVELHESERDARLRADRAQLEHVIVSLALRARDAIVDGPGKLTLSVEVRDGADGTAPPLAGARPGRYVMLSIGHRRVAADGATSVAPAALVAPPPEENADEKLRLAAVISLVRRNRGLVDVSTEPDSGASLVRIAFPALADDERDARPPLAFRDMPCGSEQVLLVQRSSYAGELLREMLEQKGYGVHLARDAAEACAVGARLGAGLRAVVLTLDGDDAETDALVARLCAGRADLGVVCLDERPGAGAPRAAGEEGERWLRLVPPIRAQDVLVGLRAVLGD